MHALEGVLLPGLLLLPLNGCDGGGAKPPFLADAETAYEQERFNDAIGHASNYLVTNDKSADAGRAYYIRGLSYGRTAQRHRARADLSTAAATTSDSDVRWRALAALGTLDFEDGRWADAAREYGTAALTSPRGAAPTDMLLYRQGLALERTGRWASALPLYQTIVDTFKTSPVLDAAQRRLDLRPDNYAVQCGAFSHPGNAENLALDLEREGLPAYVHVEPRHGSKLHVVLVGRFSSYEQALQELARVKGYVDKAVLWP